LQETEDERLMIIMILTSGYESVDEDEGCLDVIYTHDPGAEKERIMCVHLQH